MASYLQKIVGRIFGIKPDRDIVQPITPEDMRQNKLIEQLQLKNQGLEAQIAVKKAEEREITEEEKKKNIEDEIKQKLQEQKLEFKSKRFKHLISIKKFFLGTNGLNGRIDITDKDDKHIFAKFGDILIADGEEGTYLILVDNEEPANIICMGRTINDIIYNPASLNKVLKRLRIAIPYNEYMARAIDYADINVPDVTTDKNKKEIAETSEFREKLIYSIANREESINELKRTMAMLENERNELIRETRDLKMSNAQYKNQVDVSKSDLSQALSISMEYTNTIASLHKRITTLQEYENMHESMIESLKRINEALRQASEEMGEKTEFMKAVHLVQEQLKFAKDFVPRVIHEHLPPEPIKPTPVQPGEIIK